jgi:hypothetical protein
MLFSQYNSLVQVARLDVQMPQYPMSICCEKAPYAS